MELAKDAGLLALPWWCAFYCCLAPSHRRRWETNEIAFVQIRRFCNKLRARIGSRLQASGYVPRRASLPTFQRLRHSRGPRWEKLQRSKAQQRRPRSSLALPVLLGQLAMSKMGRSGTNLGTPPQTFWSHVRKTGAEPFLQARF